MILAMKPILVTSYPGPDLDAVAGVVAYAEFLKSHGKEAVAGIMGEVHDEAQYVLSRFGLESPRLLQSTDEFDQVVLVDASDIRDLDGLTPPEKVIEIIDHRQVNEADKFPNAKAHIDLVGAAATLVAERFIETRTEISKTSAILLCAAIISNTLNFKGSVTTERDKQAADWLNQRAQLPDEFAKDLFNAKSNLSGEKLIARIDGDFKRFDIEGKAIGIAQVEIIGARKMLAEREEEIVAHLSRMKENMQLDLIFQNTLDLEEGKIFLVTENTETQALLEKACSSLFKGNIAELPMLLLRKQIVPLLTQALQTS